MDKLQELKKELAPFVGSAKYRSIVQFVQLFFGLILVLLMWVYRTKESTGGLFAYDIFYLILMFVRILMQFGNWQICVFHTAVLGWNVWVLITILTGWDLIGFMWASICTAAFIITLPIVLLFPQSQVFSYKGTGPYQVGFSEFHSSKHDNKVFVFYPMEKSKMPKRSEIPHQMDNEDDKKSQASQTKSPYPEWIQFGPRQQKGQCEGQTWSTTVISKKKQANIFQRMFTLPSMNYLNIDMPTLINGKFNQQLSSNMTPVLICHNIFEDGLKHSATAIEMASFGNVVFCPNFNDGTCNFTLKSDGTPVKLDMSDYFGEPKLFEKMVAQKTEEIKGLIDDICNGNVLADKCGVPDAGKARIDGDKLCVYGHGLGAAGALKASLVDNRIKALYMTNPLIISEEDAIKEGNFKTEVPFCIIIGSGWTSVNFKLYKLHLENRLRKLVDDNSSKNAKVYVKSNMAALEFMDYSHVDPFLATAGSGKLPDVGTKSRNKAFNLEMIKFFVDAGVMVIPSEFKGKVDQSAEKSMENAKYLNDEWNGVPQKPKQKKQNQVSSSQAPTPQVKHEPLEVDRGDGLDDEGRDINTTEKWSKKDFVVVKKGD